MTRILALAFLLVLEKSFPEIGEGVVALGMAVIIENILGGPILLKRALAKARTSPEFHGHQPKPAES